MIPPKRKPRDYFKQLILKTLKEAGEPLDTENTRKSTGMKNWESVKSSLMELALQKKIKALHTSKGWVFWVERPLSSLVSQPPEPEQSLPMQQV